MTKSDIQIIEEALVENLEFMNRHPNGNDFFMERFDDNEQALAAVQRIKDGECGLRKILGQALDESEFLEIFVSDKVGNLRDGSQTVVTAYEDGRSLYKKLKENRSQ